MNKHIKIVKKWLEDNDSVSLEELEANKKSATACDAFYDAEAAYDVEAGYAYHAAEAAYAAAYDAEAAYYAEAANAEYWVKQYEERTK
jgi:hypothetical protein